VRSAFGIVLKPQGGPMVALATTGASPPQCFVDVTDPPLARMRTHHALHRDGEVACVPALITLLEPAAFLWNRLIARKQAEGEGSPLPAMVAFMPRPA
jgi:hypothetical protein